MRKRIIPAWGRGPGEQFFGNSARPVHVDVEPHGIASPGELISLSTSGARVALDAAALVLSAASVSVTFELNGTVYLLSGVTERCNLDGSISFDFDFVTRERVAAMAGELVQAGALDAALAPPPIDASRATTGPAARNAELFRELRRVRHDGPPAGIERRMQARYDLGARVAMSVLRAGRVMTGELLEISLTGCRVFAEESIPYPVRTPVEVQFVGIGYPLRLGGDIQVNRAEHVAGLIFHDVRPRMSERLNTMLDELEDRDRTGSCRAARA